MLISDRIYGKVKINSPVLIELINSKPMQRLKKIAQYGLPDEYYKQRIRNFTRFEHSLGVMILLKQLEADEEEQIAGLLHDVSHTAFSHLIDWVVSDKHYLHESFQDKQHKNFISSKEISNILKKYGYLPERIFDYKRFTLLEQKLPEICADRLDYALREFPPKTADSCINALTVSNKRIFFKNKRYAKLFAVNFLDRQENNWGSFEANARYKIFSELFRYAISRKIISFNDFWMYDAYVLDKLKKSKERRVLETLSILRKKSLRKYPTGDCFVRRKFRRVDPLYISNNKLLRLSKTDKNFKNMLHKARVENEKGTKIPII